MADWTGWLQPGNGRARQVKINLGPPVDKVAVSCPTGLFDLCHCHATNTLSQTHSRQRRNNPLN